MHPELSLVVPALNEVENLPLLYSRVVEVMTPITAAFELILVDDGSSDGTAEAVQALNAKDPRVKLVSFSRNFGHQIALTAGMDVASGDAVISMDADLQHPPELIAELVKHWREGYEIVYTVRESSEGASWFKRVTSKQFYRVFARLTGINMPSEAADFRLMDRKVVNAFRGIRERSRFLRGLTSWVGFRTLGIPYHAAARHAGHSKYTVGRMLSFAADGILSFSTIPLQLGIYVGLAMALVGFVYTVYILYASIIAHWAIPGWTSIILVGTTVGGIQLVLMGIIGLYIGKIFEEVKQRPLYLVRQTVGLELERRIPAAEQARGERPVF